MRGLCIAAMLYAAAPASAATWNPLEMRFDEQLPDIINFASKRCLESPVGTYARYERVKRQYWHEDDCGVPLDMAAIAFLGGKTIWTASIQQAGDQNDAPEMADQFQQDLGRGYFQTVHRHCGCQIVDTPVSPPVGPPPVPLPASGLVLLAGLVALMFGRGRA